MGNSVGQQLVAFLGAAGIGRQLYYVKLVHGVVAAHVITCLQCCLN